MGWSRSSYPPFVVIGIVSTLAYGLWVIWVPLLPTNLFTPLLDLGKMTGYRWSSALVYLCIVIALYGLYVAGYRVVSGGQASLIALFAWSLVFCLELVLAYPATAVDVFGYVAQGRLLAVHSVNPFVATPADFPADAIVPYVAFRGEPSQYGPTWALISGAIALVSGSNLVVEITLFKLIAVAAHLTGGGLVYAIAGRLTSDAARARACAFVYLWNPLLLWEMIGNAHNDGLMMLCGLLALWSFVSGRTRPALPMLMMGALIKVPVAVIGPVLLLGLWRQNRSAALEGAVLGVFLGAVVYRPFWVGPETLTALRRSDLFTASLGSVLRLALSSALGQADATAIARATSLMGFGLTTLWAFVRALSVDSERGVVRLAYVTLLGAVLFATTWFQAWYVVWPLAVGAALPEPRRHVEIGLLSLGGLLQYFIFIYLWVMGVFPEVGDLPVQCAAYLCIIGPLLIALGVRGSALQYRVGTPLGMR